jgi:short-subunit dehydrogenase
MAPSSSALLLLTCLAVAAAALYLAAPASPTAGLASGSRVLVTGASSGIGEELVYALARRNASLVVTARRRLLLEKVARRARELGAAEVHAVTADFATVGEGGAVVAAAVARMGGGLDAVFLNHALISTRDWVDGGEASYLRTMMQICFSSFVELATAALPHLRASDAGGRIVVSSSAAGETPVGGQAAYAAAKHACVGFFSSLRHDLALHRTNVSVTIAVIGRIDTGGSALGLNGTMKYVPTTGVEGVVEAMVGGAAARLEEVRYPWFQITMNFWFAKLLPKVHAALVILCGQSDPCTNVPEALLPLSCFSQIRALL